MCSLIYGCSGALGVHGVVLKPGDGRSSVLETPLILNGRAGSISVGIAKRSIC